MVCVRYMKQISNGHKLYTLRYPINSSTSVLLFQHDTFLMYRPGYNRQHNGYLFLTCSMSSLNLQII